MIQVVIGREGTQSFEIEDPNVSRHHAVLNIISAHEIELIDTNSTNGTFIFIDNKYERISSNMPYVVSPDTMIQLGNNTRFHVRKLMPQSTGDQGAGNDKCMANVSVEKRPAERVDISHLRNVAENYKVTRKYIKSKQNLYSSLRSATIIVGLVSTGGGKVLAQNILSDGPNQELYAWLIGIGLAVILIGVLLSIIQYNSNKLMDKNEENEELYARNYVCPKCHNELKNKIYENILAGGKCPKCKTWYYDSNNNS